MFKLTITKEICLKLLDQQDAIELYTLVDKNRRYLREWLPWVESMKDYRNYYPIIDAWLKQYYQNNGFTAGILYKGRLSGMVGFHSIDWQNQSTSIGYWLGENFQGKGIVTKVCRTLISLAFTTYNLNRIEIRAAEMNRKSRAIPERLGFQIEGKLRQAEWINDRFVDHIVYSLLKEEWKKRSGMV